MKKGKSRFNFALFYQKFGVVLLLVLICLIAAVMTPNFLKMANLRNVLRQIVIITIIASGGCFVLICGQINFAYDGLVACLGCIACMVMVKTDNPVLAVMIGLVSGAAIGYVYGICVTILKVPGFIVGLAIGNIAKGAILLATNGTKISGVGESFTVLGKGSIGPIPINVIITVIVMIACHILLSRSTFGRKVFAVGGNREAAIASGIDANSIIRKVYILDGLTAALAAMLFMARLGNGQPTAGEGYAFDAITGAVVGGCSIYGGRGSVVGCLIGAAIVGVLNNILSLMNVSSYWQKVFSGGIILLAVLIDIATKNAATVATKNMMAAKINEGNERKAEMK